MKRLAKISDIDIIKQVAAKHTRELGFILRPALVEAVRREELLFDDATGSFCHYHTRRDGVSVIYEICVPEQFRNMGIAKSFLYMIPLPIQLKCPIDNESNNFYQHLGFKLVGVEQGKKRRLNVWRLETWTINGGNGKPAEEE